MADRAIQLDRILKAKPETIYRACLEPDALVKWLPPHGFSGRVEHLDPRVGGTFRMMFTNFGTGAGHAFSGCYLELVPHEFIRHTNVFDGLPQAKAMETTITLRPVFCGTSMRIDQVGLPEAIPPEACQLGWQQSLDLLACLVEASIPG